MMKYRDLTIVVISICVLAIIGLVASDRISKKMEQQKIRAEEGFINPNDEFTQELKRISNEINVVCFDGKAKPDDIIIDKIEKYNGKREWAITKFDKGKIIVVFSNKFVTEVNDWPLIEAVMVHEMTHVLLYKRGLYDEQHGSLFHKEMDNALYNYCKANNIIKPRYEEAVAYNLLRMSTIHN